MALGFLYRPTRLACVLRALGTHGSTVYCSKVPRYICQALGENVKYVNTTSINIATSMHAKAMYEEHAFHAL